LFKITKDFIKNHKFESDGLNFPEEVEEKSFRLRAGMKLPPSADLQSLELRKKFSALFVTKYGNNYAQLEIKCDINENTMRKYLNGRRNITRIALAKFCIGTKLTVEQSAELFTLQDRSLDTKNNQFDAVVVNALQDGDDIEIFYETCEEIGLKID